MRYEVGEIAARRGSDDFAELWQYWRCHFHSGFSLPIVKDAITLMLSPERHDVGASLPRVQQQGHCQPWFGTNRPSGFELLNLLCCPSVVPLSLGTQIADLRRRISINQVFFNGVCKQMPQSLDEIGRSARLMSQHVALLTNVPWQHEFEWKRTDILPIAETIKDKLSYSLRAWCQPVKKIGMVKFVAQSTNAASLPRLSLSFFVKFTAFRGRIGSHKLVRTGSPAQPNLWLILDAIIVTDVAVPIDIGNDMFQSDGCHSALSRSHAA
ncbi:MAG TPA: hypothetical protein VJ692_13885 [Nitrospiraceae bacterium]|nr:hypothetical protein [Nitrospiraceae bacterium]